MKAGARPHATATPLAVPTATPTASAARIAISGRDAVVGHQQDRDGAGEPERRGDREVELADHEHEA